VFAVADPMDISRRLVAVFAADVEGYSRLMGADEVGTLKGLTERRAILDRIIGEHRGRIPDLVRLRSLDDAKSARGFLSLGPARFTYVRIQPPTTPASSPGSSRPG
jgi:class 3 adenylate cyclase